MAAVMAAAVDARCDVDALAQRVDGCSLAAPFVDLTHLVDAGSLASLDASLARLGAYGDGAAAGLAAGVEVSVFAAESQKYGDAVELRDRDTSAWCADAFVSRGPSDDFKLCRAHRGDSRTWRPNANAALLPGVDAFARGALKRSLFEDVGKVAVILNGRGDAGVEHADHALPDLVSEFAWVRPRTSTKRFYVRDAAGERHEVPKDCRVLWFDDRLRHGIFPVDADGQVSVRVDGRFSSSVRDLLRRAGAFADPRGGDVLASQVRGPRFLRVREVSPAAATLEAGDAVEACFGSGSVWYDAVVLSVEDREGLPICVVRYDEDSEEEELERCFVRRRPDPGAS